MKNIELIVFDIAGTTVRDRGNVADAFIAAFEEFGYAIPKDEVKKVMGFRKIDAIRQLLDKFAPEGGKVQPAPVSGVEGPAVARGKKGRRGKEREPEPLEAGESVFKDDTGNDTGDAAEDALLDREMLIDRIHSRFIDNMIFFYRNDEQLAPFPHAEKVFARLKEKGVKVALNTGFTRAITDTILHRLRWDDRFDGIDQVICSDEVPRGRPAADMIRVLVRDLGISSPEHVLKVGDTEVDVEEGRNAGCGIVVSVTTGDYTRQQLEQYQPDFIIDDLQEVLSIIEND